MNLENTFIRGLSPEQMEEVKNIGISQGFFSYCSDTDYSQYTGIAFWKDKDMCAGNDKDFDDHVDFQEISYTDLFQ